MIVCQKRVYAEKGKEPTRCLKCHGWGHLSYDCTQPFDTCSTCAGCHRMAICSNTARPQCVSCRAEGHASWDRLCPVFVCKCEEVSSRLTENCMPYFPTNEPWTHTTQPLRPSYQHPQLRVESPGPPPGPWQDNLPPVHIALPGIATSPCWGTFHSDAPPGQWRSGNGGQ